MDRIGGGAVVVVGRRAKAGLALALAGLAGLAGCDPFAAGEPETPTTTLDIPVATSAREVSRLWEDALADRSPSRVNALLAEPFALRRAGRNLSAAGLANCVADRLFKRDSLAAPDWTTTSWIPEATASSDTVRASLGYALRKGTGARMAHGEAVWTLVRVNPTEWRLWRWDDDPASDSSMLSLCMGGTR